MQKKASRLLCLAGVLAARTAADSRWTGQLANRSTIPALSDLSCKLKTYVPQKIAEVFPKRELGKNWARKKIRKFR